jgi:Domain of Unknown Function (DUF1259)
MKRRILWLPILMGMTALFAPAADNPLAKPDEEKKLDPADMKSLADGLKGRGQVVNNKVFVLSLPRDDLDVRTLDLGEVPVEAGLATTVRLWRCLCGKYFLAGEYVVTDFESDDVLDALRQGNFQIASVAPMLVRDKPRILCIRFQGEGDVEKIAKTLKEAQRWVGENRSKPKPIERQR